MASRHDRNDIAATAADWVARCDRASLSVREQAELDAWLAEDVRHVGAWARAQAVYAHFDRAAALGRHYDPERFDPERRGQPASRHRRRFLWVAGTGIAAGVAGLALLPRGGRQLSTRLGEILRVPLEDGSVLTLNSASRVEVRFSSSRRLVRLLRGEALFDVARDALRPFVVQAARATVVAVGTSFTVAREADASVRVMVREGKVDFSSDLAASIVTQRLSADMLAIAGPAAPMTVQSLEPREVRRRLAWRDGMISFEGDTLAEAARRFARYSNVHIVIDDPRVARRRVVGLYSATDPVGFAKAVALSMNLRVTRRDGDVVLSPGRSRERRSAAE